MDHPRLLLDENIGSIVAQTLRKNGLDIFSVAQERPGVSDEEVVRRAMLDERIIITFDKDFGMLVYQHKMTHAGVVLLRLDDESPKRVALLIFDLLQHHGRELSGKFTVVTENSIGIRD